jgi:hypothetical protein
MKQKMYELGSLAEILCVEQSFILNLIEIELVAPAEPATLLFDEEDLERVRLIHDLGLKFDLNEDSLQIIFHLLDQVHYLQKEIKKNRA